MIHLFGGAVPLREPSGTPRGAIGAFVDVTQLKQAEAALRLADRRKDEFLALLSHELRNPLAPILTSARLLERRADADAQRDLEVIIRQVKHLVRLVDDLLDVSRVARGRVTLTKKRLELATVVSRAVEATGPLVEERRHRLELSRTAGRPRGRRRRSASHTGRSTICSRTPRSTRRSAGPSRCPATREGNDVVLRVRDTGVGIDAALLPDVFETFVQGTRGPDRAQGGLGLGLSLVRTLTELHGGTVAALQRRTRTRQRIRRAAPRVRDRGGGSVAAGADANRPTARRSRARDARARRGRQPRRPGRRRATARAGRIRCSDRERPVGGDRAGGIVSPAHRDPRHRASGDGRLHAGTRASLAPERRATDSHRAHRLQSGPGPASGARHPPSRCIW